MTGDLQRERELFERCVEHEPADWEALLLRECPNDEGLRARVLRLLERHLDTNQLEPVFTSPEPKDPDRIGPYRILQRLGEGGMGIVYAAEQREPVRRKVAIKVLRVGHNSREVLARFDAERQAMSLMHHPNIAHILDAGTTIDHRPYIVMEFVPGQPITRYCKADGLGLRQKLELFRTVCDAVQHAHQKGVIHRDLKPSNILVMEEDQRPLAKIIDFGIAKAATQRLTEHTLETRVGSLLGTPEYMSPEQAELTPLDVDTRSDVYALGAVLYELLTGSPPLRFDPGERNFAEIQRRIKEEEPVPPSRAGTVTRDLPKELDWIVLKALEKDRNRRYLTAAAFADDVARHLANEPVEAGPHTLSYLATRFIRRHAIGVGFTAAAFLLTAGFAAIMTWQFRETALERDRANRETEIAQNVIRFTGDLFEQVDPLYTGTPEISAKELLETSVRRIERSAHLEPVVRAALLESAGNGYRGLGMYDQAERLLRDALSIRRQAKHEPDKQAEVLVKLAHVMRNKGNYAESEGLARQALSLDDSLAGRVELAGSLYRLNRLDEAEAVLEGQLRLSRNQSESAFRDYSDAVITSASILVEQGRFAEAEDRLRRLAHEKQSRYGADSPLLIQTLDKLAETLYFAGNEQGAAAIFEEIISLAVPVFGENHVTVGIAYNNLGAALAENPDRHKDAEAAYLKAREVLRAVFGELHPEVANTYINLGNLYFKLHENENARTALEQSLRIRRQTLGPEHPDTVTSQLALAPVLRRLGENERAEAIAREATLSLEATLGENHWRTGNARAILASTLRVQGKLQDAAHEYEQALAVLNDTLGPAHTRTLEAARNLQRVKTALDEHDER